MNLIDVALLQLFAHMLGDFYFQTDNSCKSKKSVFLSRKTNKNSAISCLFFYDQFAHILTIAGVVWLFSILEDPKWAWMTTNSTKGISYLLAVFFLCKPANVLIKYVMEGFELNPESEEPSLKNAGRLIGICERILLFLLLLKGLYTEAGLVLGAKSILRYNNTGKNEYVLVGTLMSVTVVAVVYAIFHIVGLA